MLEFETIYVYSEDGLVRVDLDWIGEGIDGDYDENDSEDVPLLRYGISRKFTEDCDMRTIGEYNNFNQAVVEFVKTVFGHMLDDHLMNQAVELNFPDTN